MGYYNKFANLLKYKWYDGALNLCMLLFESFFIASVPQGFCWRVNIFVLYCHGEEIFLTFDYRLKVVLHRDLSLRYYVAKHSFGLTIIIYLLVFVSPVIPAESVNWWFVATKWVGNTVAIGRNDPESEAKDNDGHVQWPYFIQSAYWQIRRITSLYYPIG